MDVPEQVLPDQLGDAQMILLEDGHCLTDQALEVCGRDKTMRKSIWGPRQWRP